MALYNATDGPNWKDNTNWLSDRPLGDWYGVTTDSNGHVTELDLGFNRLTGIIPPELGNVFKLQKLDLSGSELTGPIPAELGNLSNLLDLDLSYNAQFQSTPPYKVGGLTGPIPTQLGDLTNLERLNLGGNQLTGFIPEQLGSLSNLQELDLSYNLLTGTIPAQLGDLPNLDQLRLPGNQLTGTIPAQLASLYSLEWLNLSGNQLMGSIPEQLGGLSNLQDLDLSDNHLTGSIPGQLGNLFNLWSLDLNNNQLIGSGIPHPTRRISNPGYGRCKRTRSGNSRAYRQHGSSATSRPRSEPRRTNCAGFIPAELAYLPNLASRLSDNISSRAQSTLVRPQLGYLPDLKRLNPWGQSGDTDGSHPHAIR